MVVSTQQGATRPELAARERLLGDTGLGAGNFLQRAHAISPAPDVPFLVAQRPTAGGGTGGHAEYSMNSLVDLTRRAASRYHRAGVRTGDPVGVYVSEGIESFLQYLALTSIGAIPVLVNCRMPAEIAADYLGFVGVDGVAGDEPLLRALAEHGSVPGRFAVTPDELRLAPDGELPAGYPYQHDPDDLVMLCHSSGTTGRPKAVMFAHRQFFLGKDRRLVNFATRQDDRLLTALPQSHSAGISYLMTSVLLGLPTMVMADLSAPAVEDAMAEFQPSMVAAFSHVYAGLATRDVSGSGAGRVHTWFNTGDSAHEAHVRRLVELGRRPDEGLAGSRFVDGLGASELGMALFRRESTPETTVYRRCVGRPIEVVERAEVLDSDGSPLPAGEPGMLGVKSPTLTPGYWNDTLRTVKSRRRGYWLTGDVVYRDDDGRFFHLDRNVDVITTRVGQVYSLPVEETLMVRCPEIADCAVVGAPAEDGAGQQPIAVVSLRPGSRTEGSALRERANRELAAAGLTELAELRIATTPEELPTGPTGKVLKRQLRDRLARHPAPVGADRPPPAAAGTATPAAPGPRS